MNEKKDICNWIEQDGGLYKPDCVEEYNDDDFRDWYDIRHYNYCPYCGKHIKVIDCD